MATIKQIINQAQIELGFAQSGTVVGSSDRLTNQFKGLLERVALEVKGKDVVWPELTRIQSYTMFAVTLTGTISQGASIITGISSTGDLEVGFTVNGAAFNSTSTAQGDNVRIVSVDSATQVTVSRAADVAATAADFVFAQDRYLLPEDFDRHVFDTQWELGNRWKMIGPLTPAEWELRKNGIVASYPVKRFRVFGPQDAKFTIDAPPITADNGNRFLFEYLSRSIFRPLVWTASMSFSAGTYCSYNGQIYSTVSGGTTGSNPPVHISGSVSDGGVTWTYYQGPYERILADTDTVIFDRDIIEPGVKFYFCKAKRLKYDDYENDYREALQAHQTSLIGASTLYMGGQSYSRFIDYRNLPDTGIGQ